MTLREIWRRSGRSERRGGYPVSPAGAVEVFRDLVSATPVVREVADFGLARGAFDYRAWSTRDGAAGGRASAARTAGSSA